MKLIHVELKVANQFIEEHHRHHRSIVGHRFSLGATNKDGQLVGVAIVGRPVARMTDSKRVVEVTRLCTDGTKQACSFLYGASARAARALGYEKIQTFILADESGVSLRASGWVMTGLCGGGSWSRKSRPRTDMHPIQRKMRWERVLARSSEAVTR